MVKSNQIALEFTWQILVLISYWMSFESQENIQDSLGKQLGKMAGGFDISSLLNPKKWILEKEMMCGDW